MSLSLSPAPALFALLFVFVCHTCKRASTHTLTYSRCPVCLSWCVCISLSVLLPHAVSLQPKTVTVDIYAHPDELRRSALRNCTSPLSSLEHDQVIYLSLCLCLNLCLNLLTVCVSICVCVCVYVALSLPNLSLFLCLSLRLCLRLPAFVSLSPAFVSLDLLVFVVLFLSCILSLCLPHLLSSP